MSKVIKKPHAVADLESAIVRLVRARSSLSRSDLARELDLVASTAGIYADRLIGDGFLVERKSTAAGTGRPPVLISLNPGGGRFVGVDFDARQVLAVAVDFTQHPLKRVRRKLPANPTPDRVLAKVEEAIREAIGPRTRDVLGIGVGVPGPVDPELGVARGYRFLPGWRDVPIRDRLRASFKVPVHVENNARALALGELWCGRGRGLRNLVALSVRTGIGAGIVIDGKLLQGAGNRAGELGAWARPEDALPSPDAASPPASIEDAASVASLLAHAGGDRTLPELLRAADFGDRPARLALERVSDYHAWVLHQLALVFDPERLIVGGPLVESRLYRDSVHAAAARLAGPEVAARVVTSDLGPFAGALGASSLAFHLWRPRR
jgi:predicted NBD/HSP70 family sugar kinase